jgi:hypothetical protein
MTAIDTAMIPRSVRSALSLLLVAADPAVSGARRQFEAAVLERGAQAGVGVAHHLDLAAAAGVEQHVLGAFAPLGANRHRAHGVRQAGLRRTRAGDTDPAGGDVGADDGRQRFARGQGDFGAARAEEREVALGSERQAGEQRGRRVLRPSAPSAPPAPFTGKLQRVHGGQGEQAA